MRLERRRVLSADFALGASGILLDGFDGEFGESLHIAQTENEYQFILAQGDWNTEAEPPGGVAEVDGAVLSVSKQYLDAMPEGVLVQGDASVPLDVTISSSVDMSSMAGPLSIVDARSLSQADTPFAGQGGSGEALSVVPLVAADPPATTPGLTVTSLNFAGDLELSSLGPIVDEPGTSISVTGDATFISRLLPAAGSDPAQPGGIFLADSMGDRLSVGGHATFEAQSSDTTERFNINVGDAGDAKFGSLSLIGAEVAIEDDSPTVLVAIDAAELQLDSRGVITDAPNAAIEVSGNATLRSSDQVFATDFQADFNGDRQIDVADYSLWKNNFGQTATVGTPTPVGDANLDGVVDAADFTFWRDAFGQTASLPGITISDNNTSLSVGGLLNLIATTDGTTPGATGADRFDITVADAVEANFGTLSFTGGVVSIFEDSDSVLSSTDPNAPTVPATSTANTLALTSDGAITDDGSAVVEVAGLAAFDSTTTSAITLDDQYQFGSLQVSGGAVTVVETSSGTDPNPGTVLSGASDANSLTITSDGAITDDGTAEVEVAGLASFDSTTTSAITLDDQYQFGSLQVSGGVVTVLERSVDASDPNPGTVLSGASDATTLSLFSGGAITDDGTAQVEVTGLALFDSKLSTTSPITLDDTYQFGSLQVIGGVVTVLETSLDASDPTPGTVLSRVSEATTLTLISDGAIADDDGLAVVLVSGLASFDSTTTSAITLDDQNQFGSLRVSGGAVSVVETSQFIIDPNPGTVLSGASDAVTLALTSSGAITDDGTAVVEVAGLASFDSTTTSAITLDDQYQFGSLQVSGGAVTVVETSSGTDPNPGTVLSGASDANSLTLTSDGALTDDATAVLRVALPGGDASFDVDGSITLADAGSANSFIVEGHARFEVSTGNSIDVGVDAAGLPADANAQSGTVQFIAPDGNVRIAYDGPVFGAAAALQLAASSEATTAILDTQGSGDLTDSADATLELSSSTAQAALAELRAVGRNVVVGNPAHTADTRAFSIETPTLFDSTNYLAVEAANASIRAQSQINLLTGLNQTPFSGSFFLQTEGSLAQVGDVLGDTEVFSPLTADRVALASVDGGVFFSQIELTSDVDLDTTAPNLSLHAGGGESFAAVLSTQAEFPLEQAVGGALGEFLPIGVSLDPSSIARVDASGLNDVSPGAADAVITDPAALGDRHSIVAVVHGDAKVGRVSDATGAQTDRVGVLVSDTTGNAFLRTVRAGDEDGGVDEDLDVGEPLETVESSTALASLGADPGDLVFSSRDLLGDGSSTGSGPVVQILSGVFTAIAFGALKIDTEDADEASSTLTTTRLTSSNGAVTSVGDFEGDDFARVGDEVVATPTTQSGPRVILDTPSQDENAATTDLVRPRETDDGALFEQRVTLAIGSRGEDNLIVEFEWADVATRREDSRVDPDPTPFTILGRDNPLGPEVEGVIATPDVAWAPESLDGAVLDGQLSPDLDPLVLNRSPEESFRIVVARHDYTNEFIASNPLPRFLPTTVRVYNDPAINLFAQDGALSLNANVLFVEPEVITFLGGDVEYNLSIERPDPPKLEAPRLIVARPSVFSRAVASTDLQVVAASDVETVLYGKVDPNDPEKWATDVPSESWPRQWEQVEGDYIEDIKALIDASPASEGRYKIVTETPRGQLQLEQWIKSDTQDVESANQPAVEQSIDEPPTGDGARDAAPTDFLEGERIEPDRVLPDPFKDDGDSEATLPPPGEDHSPRPPVEQTGGVHKHLPPPTRDPGAAPGDHASNAAASALAGVAASALATRTFAARTASDASGSPPRSSAVGFSSADRRRRRIASLFGGE